MSITCGVHHGVVVTIFDLIHLLPVALDRLKICLNVAVSVDDLNQSELSILLSQPITIKYYLIPVEDSGPAAVECQCPEIIGGLVTEECVAQHEPEHDPPLHGVQRQVLTWHCISVSC